MTAVHLRLIDCTSRWINCWGILFQASIDDCCSCGIVVGGGRRLRISLSILSQRCSITFKSGDNAGHGVITRTLFCCKNVWVTKARCAGALSCWNTPSPVQTCPVESGMTVSLEETSASSWVSGNDSVGF